MIIRQDLAANDWLYSHTICKGHSSTNIIEKLLDEWSNHWFHLMIFQTLHNNSCFSNCTFHRWHRRMSPSPFTFILAERKPFLHILLMLHQNQFRIYFPFSIIIPAFIVNSIKFQSFRFKIFGNLSRLLFFRQLLHQNQKQDKYPFSCGTCFSLISVVKDSIKEKSIPFISNAPFHKYVRLQQHPKRCIIPVLCYFFWRSSWFILWSENISSFIF